MCPIFLRLSIASDGRLLTLEEWHFRLIEYFKKHEGVEFVTMEEMAAEFRKKNDPAPGAVLPAAPGAILR